MEQRIEAIKGLLNKETIFVEDQWQLVKSIIYQDEKQTINLLRWIFVEYRGYTEFRSRAGLEYYKTLVNDGLQVIESLLRSKDPDDRDVAISVLKQIDGHKTEELALLLLNDEFPYLRFEAIELLKDNHPQEVITSLLDLQNNKEEWVRVKTTELMNRISGHNLNTPIS